MAQTTTHHLIYHRWSVALTNRLVMDSRWRTDEVVFTYWSSDIAVYGGTWIESCSSQRTRKGIRDRLSRTSRFYERDRGRDCSTFVIYDDREYVYRYRIGV